MNISNIIAAIQYAPAVSSAVQAVEASSASLPNATKKQLVLAGLTAAAKVGEAVPEAHVALVSELIDIIVEVLKGAGVFGKVAVPVAAPVPVPAKA